MQRSNKKAIKISFFGLLMLLALVISHSYISFAAIAAAAIHELAHIFAASSLGISIGSLRLGIFGASLSIDQSTASYKDELLIALAGPAANLVCSALTVLFLPTSLPAVNMFLGTSLFLGLLNLLPISDFDGGRILFCALATHTSLSVAQTIIRISSFVFIFSLWALSVYLILRLGASLSLFVFSASVFCRIFIKSR